MVLYKYTFEKILVKNNIFLLKLKNVFKSNAKCILFDSCISLSEYYLLQVRLPPEINRVLYIRNLPYKITAEEMYDIFGKYGAIRQIRVLVY